MSKIFSVVIPVYQNVENIKNTLARLMELRGVLPEYTLELVFVDDGSTDGSQDLLLHCQAENPEIITLVLLTRNFGQTPAIQAGLKNAQGHCVGIISCDLQEPHEKFVDMVQLWEQGALFVVGERTQRSEGIGHRTVSSAYWTIVRTFALKDFPVAGYDFCLLDRKVVEEVKSIPEKNTSIFPLLWWLGYRAERVSITRSLRERGRSQWSFWRKVGFTLDTVIGFTHIPARVISGVGILGSALSVTFTLVMAYNWLTLQAAPPGWMTVVAMMGFGGSLILLGIGTVIEYLVRILDESRSRPPYVVERLLVRSQPG